MANRLSTRCDGQHKHQHLLGGRAEAASFDPMKLVTESLRGMRDHADATLGVDSAGSDDYVSSQNPHRTRSVASIQDVSLSASLQAKQQDKQYESKGKHTSLRMHDGTSKKALSITT